MKASNITAIVKNRAEKTISVQNETKGDFTAIVLAGSRGDCPVASVFGEQYKALVPICGKPMISRVVEALADSRSVKKVIIVFDCETSLYSTCPEFHADNTEIEISVVSCGTSICDSVRKAIDSTKTEWPYLVTTADHALLTSEIVDRFCDGASYNCDLAVGLVEKKYLDAQHPNSKRTYLPFKETKLSGANLFAFVNPNAESALSFWKTIEKQRKKPWKLFAAFGWKNVVGLVMKRFTVDEAFMRASGTLGVQVKAVRLPNAEAAIDVDSPKDYAQVSEILQSRSLAI
ncbi:nucleotidyltransferase family protein [Kordiimonas sp. SCSIO 12603]|uniref:NTP transferase domain-containing protein n=1 Tax=Kordiimonas sp. SCSIO 12603 TaxID=2829596 RepID=UPI0021075CB0|nr:NTP transferase domain-containing protein [Kordiimonas sp. SCSIO 12603]UTW57433.1 nucleotidyltransferase family protein [Kordiimonas sp. SCSIO 12603]